MFFKYFCFYSFQFLSLFSLIPLPIHLIPKSAPFLPLFVADFHKLIDRMPAGFTDCEEHLEDIRHLLERLVGLVFCHLLVQLSVELG